MIPDNIIKRINKHTGYLKGVTIEQALVSDENINFIMERVLERLKGKVSVDTIKSHLNPALIRDAIVKRIELWDPILNDLNVIDRVNRNIIDTYSSIIEEDPHWDPIMQGYQYAKWGYDISSIKNGWKPGDLIFNNIINRKSPYWKPVNINMVWDKKQEIELPDSATFSNVGAALYPRKNKFFSGTGIIEGELPGPNYTGNIKVKDAYEQTTPGFKYYSKSYDYKKSKVYPAWNPGLSYNHLNSNYPEGRRGPCGSDDKMQMRRLVSTVPELKWRPSYRWDRYNDVPVDRFYYKYWNI